MRHFGQTGQNRLNLAKMSKMAKTGDLARLLGPEEGLEMPENGEFLAFLAPPRVPGSLIDHKTQRSLVSQFRAGVSVSGGMRGTRVYGGRTPCPYPRHREKRHAGLR